MSSFARSSTAFRRVFVRIILAAALAALLAPCLDAIDIVAKRIADHALDRPSSRSEARYARTSRETSEARGTWENGAGGEQADREANPEADPECNSWDQRAEVDDVDERPRSGCVDSAVLSGGPEKVLTEDSVRVRTEDRRRKRPPNLRA